MKISFKKLIWMSIGGGAVLAFIIGWNILSSHKEADAGCVPICVDTSHIVKTSDAKAATCPPGYVAIGFDCTGGCDGEKMELICGHLGNC